MQTDVPSATLPAALWQAVGLTIARGLFGLALLVPMLTSGGVEYGPLCAIGLLVSASAVLVCRRPLASPHIGWIAAVALTCLAGLLAVEFLQSLRFVDNAAAHPAWTAVAEFVGPVGRAISVAPETTRADLVAWSPLLAFVAALHLYNRTSEAFRLIRSLSALNIAVTVVGLVQFVFFPDSLGFGAKEHYQGSLTGLYVNRNSAGTFFGLGIVIDLGLIAFHLRETSPANLVRRIVGGRRLTAEERKAAYLAGFTLLQVLALGATQSRGAAAATFIAILALVASLAPRHRVSAARPHTPLPAGWKRLLLAGCLASAGAVLAAQEAVYRMSAQSVDEARLCTYASAWHAVVDSWPWGHGFGSFQQVFPAYRAWQCAGIDGIWDAAHNSYLEGALGLGLTFVIAVATAIAVLAWVLWNGLRQRRRHRFAPAVGIASLILVGLHSLVDFSMQVPGNALFVAALLAASVTISLAPANAAASSTGQSQPPFEPLAPASSRR